MPSRHYTPNYASNAPSSVLNDIRREFYSAARSARKRLAVWEAKHVSKHARPRLAADREVIQEPYWWHSGFYAVPGGNVIVQEEDWGIIIAFTLSSFDYQRELGACEPDESSRTTCTCCISTFGFPHLRHHVNNTQCRRLVDPLLPVQKFGMWLRDRTLMRSSIGRTYRTIAVLFKLNILGTTS